MKQKLLCLFMLIFNYSFAQSNLIDSFVKLKNTDERISFLSNDNVTNLGKNGCYALKTELQKNGDDKALFFLCVRINDFYVLDAKELKINTDLMFDISKRNNFKAELLVTNFKSTINIYGGNLISEQEAYYRYLNIFEGIKNTDLNSLYNYGLEAILYEIGRNFYEVGDYEKALECLILLEKKVKIQNIFYVLSLNLMETIYAKQKQYNLSMIYAYKIYKFSSNNKNISNLQIWQSNFWSGFSALNIAKYAQSLGKHKICLYYLSIGQKLLVKNIDLKNISMLVSEVDALQIIIQIKLGNKQYNEAEKLLKRSFYLENIIVKEGSNVHFKPLELYKNSVQFYEQKGNHIRAFYYLKIVNQIEDSLNIRNDKRKLWQSEMKVKSEVFNEKLKTIQDDNAIGTNTRNAIILSLFVLLAIAFIVYQKINKDNKVIEKQKNLLEQSLLEKEVLLKELHHRVKNNLQIISGLFEKQIKKTDDPKVKRLIKEAQDRIFSIALVHQNLHQSELLNGVQFNNYLNLLVNNIVDTNNFEEKSLEIITKVDDFIMNFDHAISVALIVNELITNCYKHAFVNRSEGKIEVNCSLQEQKVYLSICDNGIGFSTNEEDYTNKTLGMGLLKGLARQIKGIVNINSSEKGTCVQIIFDYKN
ncbi:MAG: sensor histidine kinase [Bacteroidota bacterium]